MSVDGRKARRRPRRMGYSMAAELGEVGEVIKVDGDRDVKVRATQLRRKVVESTGADLLSEADVKAFQLSTAFCAR